MAHATRLLELPGGRASIELREEGHGPPLVYLHDVFGLDGWPGFLHRLAARFTVAAPLLPGWGGSTGVAEIDDIRDLALAYLDVFDALGLQRAHLVGHGLGGMLAAEIAAMDRSYVGRLVLVAPFGLWLDDAQPADIFTMTPSELARALYHDPSSAAAQRALARPPTTEAAGEAILRRHQSLGTAAKFLWPLPDQGTARRLHRITAPTLIVWGRDDQIVPVAHAKAFHDAISGSRVVTIDKAGHLPMEEQEEAFLDAVAGFLASSDP